MRRSWAGGDAETLATLPALLAWWDAKKSDHGTLHVAIIGLSNGRRSRAQLTSRARRYDT